MAYRHLVVTGTHHRCDNHHITWHLHCVDISFMYVNCSIIALIWHVLLHSLPCCVLAVQSGDVKQEVRLLSYPRSCQVPFPACPAATLLPCRTTSSWRTRPIAAAETWSEHDDDTEKLAKSCYRHTHQPALFQAGRVSSLDPQQLIRRTVTAPPWEERDSLQLSHIYSSLLHVHFLNIFFLNVISMRLKYNFKNKRTFSDLNYC